MKTDDLSKCSFFQKSILSAMVSGGHSGRLVACPNNASAQGNQLQLLERNGLLENSRLRSVETVTNSPEPRLAHWSDELRISHRAIKSLSEFESVGPLWDKFEVDPMSSFDWNYSWWKSFQDTGDLHLLTFEKAGEIVGLAPFFVDRWFGLRRFRFLAAGKVCSDYLDIVCKPEHYELCADSLAQYVREMNFDVVELECTKENRLAKWLKPQLTDKYRIDERMVEPTWRLELPETWKEFVASTKGSLRRKINKAVRRIDSDEFEVSSTADGADIDSAFEVLKELHTLRFNSKNEPGVFGDDRFTEFLHSSVKELCQQGKCEIVVASKQGKPFAVQMYFDTQDGYQFYQGGNDPEAMKLEPGHFLFTFMVRRAVERGDNVFDFLRGNEPYKAFWGASPHSHSKMRMISKGVLPTLVSATVEKGRRLFRKA